MNPPLTPEQLEALRRLDACTLANAIETFHQRLRNEGFVAGGIVAWLIVAGATYWLRGPISELAQLYSFESVAQRRRPPTACIPTAPIGGNTSFPCPGRG